MNYRTRHSALVVTQYRHTRGKQADCVQHLKCYFFTIARHGLPAAAAAAATNAPTSASPNAPAPNAPTAGSPNAPAPPAPIATPPAPNDPPPAPNPPPAGHLRYHQHHAHVWDVDHGFV